MRVDCENGVCNFMTNMQYSSKSGYITSQLLLCQLFLCYNKFGDFMFSVEVAEIAAELVAEGPLMDQVFAGLDVLDHALDNSCIRGNFSFS